MRVLKSEQNGAAVSGDRRNVPAVVETATPVKTTALRSKFAVPAVIADAGDHAARRFLEFFAATIRNKNTRMAYRRGVCNFFAWLDQHGIMELVDIEPIHVAAYVEILQASAPNRPSSSTWPPSGCCSTGWSSAMCWPRTRPTLCAGQSMS
jgi:hypothetical protein